MLTDAHKDIISSLQNAIWKLDEAHELIQEAFPSKTDEEIDALFRGSIPEIIAKLEIGINVTYES